MIEKDDLYYIRLVRKGDVDSFVHIVRKYNRMIFTVINRVIQRREEAEDITQEVFLKVFQRLDKFREEAEFSTWLYRIAYNTAIYEFRKKKNELAFDDNYANVSDSYLDDTLDNVTKEEQLKCLEELLVRMPKDDALLITLFYLNKCTINEIGDITGLSTSNVKVKLHRIRKYMNLEMNKMLRNG